MTEIWQPDSSSINQSEINKYKEFLKRQYNLTFSSYHELWLWSIKTTDIFWDSICSYFQVKLHQQASSIYQSSGEAFYQGEWFQGAKLNFAENLLQGQDDKCAILFINEQGQRSEITYQLLRQKVARLANRMRELDIKPGDRIAGLMPNCIETIIAMLASASIGAIWSSCSPDFGIQGALDRFGQINPKLLFTVDGYHYNGKTHDCLDKVEQITRKLDGLEGIIVHPLVDAHPALTKLVNASLFESFLSDNDTLSYESLPFNHPLYIMYSSGTTGTPKCIVHGAGGTLLQHLKELALHSNMTVDDNLFFFTTCGWMMWNWMVSGLALGGQLTLYDGSPSYPNPDRLFDIVATHDVTIFGCGAKYLDAVEKANCQPAKTYDLSSLKAILSTGSPLLPHSYDFVYQAIKENLQLSSISGGTDIISCFALGNPILPVYRGELQCLGLGMDVAVYDQQGHAVIEQKGELVCQKPFPSMPIHFWNDPGDNKYRAAYFERFDGCWAHGDYAEITAHHGMIIYGRSDAILNPGGVRIGTAEIYRQVEKVEEILDSVVVGQPWQGDERVVLFVRLKPDHELDESLIAKIKQIIRQNATPRHVPTKIIQVADIPKTISGKVVELAVKKVICGETVVNQDALANPQALELFKNLSELAD